MTGFAASKVALPIFARLHTNRCGQSAADHLPQCQGRQYLVGVIHLGHLIFSAWRCRIFLFVIHLLWPSFMVVVFNAFTKRWFVVALSGALSSSTFESAILGVV